MIGILPKHLLIGNEKYPIRSDYRICLAIIQMFNDKEMTIRNKNNAMIEMLYKNIPDNDFEETVKQAIWFLDCGKKRNNDNSKDILPQPRLMDWVQDEQLIFAEINKQIGHIDIRSLPYEHWWTFIGRYMTIGDGLFMSIVSIRKKIKAGKKLDESEREFYNQNRDMIDLEVDMQEKNDVIDWYLNRDEEHRIGDLDG